MRTVSCPSRVQSKFCLTFWGKSMSVFLNFILNSPYFLLHILSEFPSRFMFFNINGTTQRMISVVNFLDQLFATRCCTPCNQTLALIPTNLGIFPPSLKIIPTQHRLIQPTAWWCKLALRRGQLQCHRIFYGSEPADFGIRTRACES